MVREKDGALIHYFEPGEDVKLLSRKEMDRDVVAPSEPGGRFP
jgi:hypothetical protein